MWCGVGAVVVYVVLRIGRQKICVFVASEIRQEVDLLFDTHTVYSLCLQKLAS